MKIIRSLILYTLSIIAFSSVSFADEGNLDTVVAVVNSNVITASQLDKQVTIAKQQLLAAGAPIPSAGKLRQQVLDQLINTNLQLQLAKKANITVSDSQVDQAISDIATKNNVTVAQLQTKVTQQGMSFATYREEIRKEMLVSEVQQHEVGPTVTVSDQEVSDMINMLKTHPEMNGNQAITDSGAQFHIIDILIPSKQQATALLEKLQQTKDTASILNGDASIQVNDMGWRRLAELPDLFAKTVTDLATGQFSDPLHAPNGFHILQLVAKQGAKNAMSFNSQASASLPQAHVQMILIKKNPLFSDQQMQAHLQLIRSQIIESGDFAHVAENNSQDPTSASKGGDMGWVSPGTLPPQVDQVISQLKIDELSQPISTPTGFYLIQVVGKRQMNDAENALSDRARQLVFQRKYGEALQNWLQRLRSQSYVKIND